MEQVCPICYAPGHGAEAHPDARRVIRVSEQVRVTLTLEMVLARLALIAFLVLVALTILGPILGFAGPDWRGWGGR